jgi:hypothetical protein
MAIKITSDAIVRIVRPLSKQFELDEINSHVSGWIEPFKIGPLWIMYKEKSKEEGEEFNQVASFFFDVAIYGTVLIVPPKQMPTEWDIVEPDDNMYTSDQIESGFLSSLQQALIYNRTMGGLSPEDFLNLAREEWIYDPTDEIDEHSIEFFKNSYQYIIDQPHNDENILYEDEDVIIRTLTPESRLKTLNQMLDYFVESEDYEKCAAIRDLIQSYQ